MLGLRYFASVTQRGTSPAQRNAPSAIQLNGNNRCTFFPERQLGFPTGISIDPTAIIDFRICEYSDRNCLEHAPSNKQGGLRAKAARESSTRRPTYQQRPPSTRTRENSCPTLPCSHRSYRSFYERPARSSSQSRPKRQ